MEQKRSLVLVGIMLAMFMAAIEGTIVATAMPSIVGQLGGFSLFSWVFSAFLLAQAVTIPIYGKLADLFGRKPVFTTGAIIFLAGSLLCGLAGSMQQLIIFRLVQGVGAGAVQPIAVTMVGDLFNVTERAKVQGLIASVWGVSAIVGPAIGGIFVQYVAWSWIFWMNLPVGLLAILLIQLYLHEKISVQKHRIDYIGSILIFLSISFLMLFLVQSGVAWAWWSWQAILLAGLSVIGLFLFIWTEAKAAEPLMPLEIWHNSLIAVANLATLSTGIIIMGLSSFLPTFIQGVMGQSPIMAGFALAAMSVGWPLASTISGKLLLHFGTRTLAVAGGIFILLGSILLVLLNPQHGWWLAAAGSFMVGVGMGLARTVFIVAIQNSVSWQQRGVVTASNMFMNILGSTLGAAVLGAVLNNRLSAYLRTMPAAHGLNLDIVNVLLDAKQRAVISLDVLTAIQTGLTSALHDVFWGVALVALLSLTLVIFLPNLRQTEAMGSSRD